MSSVEGEMGGATPRARRQWWVFARELLIVSAGVVVYFGVRGLTNANPGVAVRHAVELVGFEQHLDLYVEPHLQDLVDDSPRVLTVMNWIYIWGHWPVIAAVLLWLFLEHPLGYRRTRNAMLLSGGIGLVAFALFPVAPPRLAELGLIDTVTEYSKAYRVLQPPAFVNQYAAMPSLHVGWDLLMGLAVFTYARWWTLRLAGVLLPVLMVVSVVLTANHYIIDVVGGALLVLVSMFVVRRLEVPPAAKALSRLAWLPRQRGRAAAADPASGGRRPASDVGLTPGS